MLGTYHGNKLNKLGKMIWLQFPTKVLQIWLAQDKCHYKNKKLFLEQSLSLHNKIHDIINPKFSKRKGRRI